MPHCPVKDGAMLQPPIPKKENKNDLSMQHLFDYLPCLNMSIGRKMVKIFLGCNDRHAIHVYRQNNTLFVDLIAIKYCLFCTFFYKRLF